MVGGNPQQVVHVPGRASAAHDFCHALLLGRPLIAGAAGGSATLATIVGTLQFGRDRGGVVLQEGLQRNLALARLQLGG